MSQVSGPVIAVGLVLSAVFVPCAFISGITGQFFRQFALTIAASTIISTFNSLTLSPALSAVLLRPRDKDGARGRCRGCCTSCVGGWLGYGWLAPWLVPRIERLLAACRRGLRRSWLPAAPVGGGRRRARSPAGWLGLAGELAPGAGSSAGSTPAFAWPPDGYTRAVGMLLRVSALVLVVYGGLLCLTYWQLHRHAQGLHPHAGHGLPDGGRAIARRGLGRADRRRHGPRAEICMNTPGVKHTVAWPASRSCSAPTPRTSARCS